MNEDTLQSEQREREQVFSHEVKSSSKEEPVRMARGEPRFQANTSDFGVEVPEFEGKLDLESSFISYIQLKEPLNMKTFLMIKRSS